ncbi:MAG: YaiI/YqxD family protein [Pseudobdellovibrio sp.]
MLNIYIDADACPVKEETYKVANRYQLNVFVIANQYIQVPLDSKIEMKIVAGGFDSADDWIAEHIEVGDILITSDLLLADRCLKKKARVLGSKGKELDDENIGNVLGGRELMSHLRDLGQTKTGPSAMTKSDRSQFLSKLDQIIQSLIRLNGNKIK